MSSFFNKNNAIYIIVFLLALIPIFGFMDVLSVRIWDEARNANNAFEMHKNANYLVSYFNGKPDMWNTKPPFLIWCQVFWMKIIGVSIYAIRLPSALAALGTITIIIIFCKKIGLKKWFGLLAVLVLVSSYGYMGYHGVLNGDFDAMLTFFTTTAALSYFIFLEIKSVKYLYLFFGALVLAVLTKSIAGLLILPGLFLYTLIKKDLINVLKLKHLYIGIMGFVVIVGAYYLGRESINPGYLKYVSDNELLGRYNEVQHNSSQGFWFYLKALKASRFNWWYIYAVLGVILGLFSKKKQVKNLTIYATLLSVLFLLIISLSKTKLSWYDLPVFPFLALLTSIFLVQVASLLGKVSTTKSKVTKILFPIAFIILLLYRPYVETINSISKKESVAYIETHMISYFLRDALRGKQNAEDVVVLYDGYAPHIRFYVNALQDKGIHVDIKNYKYLKEGDVVIANQWHVQDYLEKNYPLKGIRAYDEENYNKLKKYKIVTWETAQNKPKANQ